ncbi:MAG: pepsin/retropepsin-like aspartic protease family protein [Dehalococcoidales bacterium]
MSICLKYQYRKFETKPSEAFPRRFSVSRPVIPIQLISGVEKVGYLALIDSGADFCVFHASIGETIGVDIESGKKQGFSGVSNQSQQLTAYFHTIQIEVGGYKYDCWAGFSRDIEGQPYGILGQQGFFSLFNVTFDYEKEHIELRQKDPA